MSAETHALVRRWFDGLGEGKPDPELCDPEIEIVNWAESPAPGPYHGHEGVLRWWSDIQDSFEHVRIEMMDVIDAGDERVVTVQRLVGRYRLTGIDLDHTWGSVVSVRRGRIASAVGYISPGRAKRAAGLQP